MGPRNDVLTTCKAITLVGSRELQSCTVYNHPLPAVYNVLHKTKFPSNVSEYKLSNNIKHSFFELDAWTKSKHTKLYWKKKSNVKTESPLGKQKSQGNLTSARFRRKMLTIQANWGAKSKIEMISTCRFKDLFLGKQMYWHFHREYIF